MEYVRVCKLVFFLFLLLNRFVCSKVDLKSEHLKAAALREDSITKAHEMLNKIEALKRAVDEHQHEIKLAESKASDMTIKEVRNEELKEQKRINMQLKVNYYFCNIYSYFWFERKNVFLPLVLQMDLKGIFSPKKSSLKKCSPKK